MVENCHLPAIPSYNQHFTGSSKCCYSNFFFKCNLKKKVNWRKKDTKSWLFTKTAILCFMTERKLDLKQKTWNWSSFGQSSEFWKSIFRLLHCKSNNIALIGITTWRHSVPSIFNGNQKGEEIVIFHMHVFLPVAHTVN